MQAIPLPNVKGRLDHMGVDLEQKRLFVAAVGKNTLEVIDLALGRVLKSLTGFKNTQDALFLGGNFNKLNVSSLDDHLRIFQGETFNLVQDFKVEPDPNRLLYDPATNLVYFGYGGQNAGFDQLVADMTAPTPRPGHLAEIRMDDDRRLLPVTPSLTSSTSSTLGNASSSRVGQQEGDGATDLALDQASQWLFIGTRNPPEMTVYDSESGQEIQALQAPETMDGLHYDAQLKRIYLTGGRWYGSPEASSG
jgi:hypothetical protein